MKKLLTLLILLCLEKALHAQYVYTIKADSVKITNTCDTAELIIENHTQNVCGFLFNKGRGRTEFRRGLVRVNDSVSVIGCDTLKLNPWLQGGNRFGNTGIFGTMDNNHIDFYSNNTRRARLTNDGSFQIGNVYQYGDMFQVSNTGIVSIPGLLSRSSDIIQLGHQLNSGDGQNVLLRTSNDHGATFKNIMVERDGNIGLGSSNRPVGGWVVGDPALRIYSNGLINFASGQLVFGNPNGETNSSGLYTYVSSFDEWKTGVGNYPSRQHYYFFGVRLQGGEASAARADLRIGARNLRFFTGSAGESEGTEAATITENRNMLIGTTTDNGDKFQLNGSFWQYTGVARFGNGIYLNEETGRPRLFANNTIIYQSNYTGDQHLFSNAIGTDFTGTLVTIDPGTYPGLSDSQLSLKVWGKDFAQGLSVNMAGRVGVGTMAPTAQLHAKGTVRFSDLTNNNNVSRIVVCDANGYLYYKDEDSSSAFNGTFNSDVVINGRVSAKQMLITQTGCWPDYVFSKQYKLPSLTEVENFINQHSHLPGIPSAAEVDKKGLDVGLNQAALLKKIEELTLYIIEQDKTIKKQNDKINDLLHLKQEMAELKALIKNM